MLDGLKEMFSSDKDKKPDNPKTLKRIIIILVSIVFLTAVHMGYTYIGGTTEEKTEMTEFIKTHFHINYIDLALIIVSGIAYLIFKIKKNRNK